MKAADFAWNVAQVDPGNRFMCETPVSEDSPMTKSEQVTWVAQGLKTAAVLVGFFTLGALIVDLFTTSTVSDAAVPQVWLHFRNWIGCGIRTSVLGLATYLLWGAGQTMTNPKTTDEKAYLRRRLREILSKEARTPPPVDGTQSGFYRHATDAELIEVYESFDRNAIPERFYELIGEIRQRLGR